MSSSSSRHPSPRFPSLESTPTQARTQEIQQGRPESRLIRTAVLTAEPIGFPLAEQDALLFRQVNGRKDEPGSVGTRAQPEKRPAQEWLQYIRCAWGIENGTPQRLDISHNDDRGRIHGSNGIWVMGMFRRLSNSPLVEGRSRQRKPEHPTTTDFQTLLTEEHLRRALRTVLSERPGFD